MEESILDGILVLSIRIRPMLSNQTVAWRRLQWMAQPASFIQICDCWLMVKLGCLSTAPLGGSRCLIRGPS
jgi:hypothetical protein